MSTWDERVRWSVSLGRKLAPTDSPKNDGQSGKTTNSSGVKTLEMIPGASGLQIECGLFLWLSSDVGMLLQGIDVACMECVELELIHGGDGHGWGQISMEMAMGLGEEEDGLRGSLTMPWGSSKRSSSAGNTAQREIELRAPPCLEVEDDGFWAPSNSGEASWCTSSPTSSSIRAPAWELPPSSSLPPLPPPLRFLSSFLLSFFSL